jgi:plastocyanin
VGAFMSLLRDSLCATIDNFMFKPDTITVPVGTTVVWQNDDEIPRTVTSLDGTFHLPALDTKAKCGFTSINRGRLNISAACIRV